MLAATVVARRTAARAARGWTAPAAPAAAPHFRLGAHSQGARRFADVAYPHVQRLLRGVDRQPQPRLDGPLSDTFFKYVLKGGQSPAQPLTPAQLVEALGRADSPLGDLRSFVVTDGLGIPFDAAPPTLERDPRFVLTCKTVGLPSNVPPDVFIVFSFKLDDRDAFLQAFAWDPALRRFNFYLRPRASLAAMLGTAQSQAWLFNGNSWDALVPPTRGQGPFDGHVSGAPLMKVCAPAASMLAARWCVAWRPTAHPCRVCVWRCLVSTQELKSPWPHWNSSESDATDYLDPSDPALASPLFFNRTPADTFELMIRASIDLWTNARVQKVTTGTSVLAHPEHLLRQLLRTDTVNIVAARQQSLQLPDPNAQPQAIVLPFTNFFPKDALEKAAAVFVGDGVGTVAVPYDLYRQSVDKPAAPNVFLRMRSGTFEQRGDAFFAFPTPEPAYEDVSLLSVLTRPDVALLSPKFVASALMVDFSNPVYSTARASLLKYCPATASLAPPAASSASSSSLRSNLEQLFVEAVRKAPTGAAEAEFLRNYDTPGNWQAAFSQRIAALLGAVQKRIAGDRDASYTGKLQLLADSRRRRFRATKLSEFDLTLPALLPRQGSPHYRMTPDGDIVEDAP